MAESIHQNIHPSFSLGPAFDVCSATLSETGLLAQTESSYGLGNNQNIFDGNKEAPINLSTDSTSLEKLASPNSKAVLTLNGDNSRHYHEDGTVSHPPTGQSTESPNSPLSIITKAPKVYVNSYRLIKTAEGSGEEGCDQYTQNEDFCENYDFQGPSKGLRAEHKGPSDQIDVMKRRSSSLYSAISSTWRQKRLTRGKSQGESISSKSSPISRGFMPTVNSLSVHGARGKGEFDWESPNATRLSPNDHEEVNHRSSLDKARRSSSRIPPVLHLRGIVTDGSWKGVDHEDGQSADVKSDEEDEQEDLMLICRKTVDSLEMAKRTLTKKVSGPEADPSDEACRSYEHRAHSRTSSPLRSVKSLCRSIRKQRSRKLKLPKKGTSVTTLPIRAVRTAAVEPTSQQENTKSSDPIEVTERRWVFFGYEHHRFETSNYCCPLWREKAKRDSVEKEQKAPPPSRTSTLLEKPDSAKQEPLCCPEARETLPPPLPPRKKRIVERIPLDTSDAPLGDPNEGHQRSKKGSNVLFAWLTDSFKGQLRPGVRKLESFFKIEHGDGTDTEEEDENESLARPIAESAFLPSSADPKSAEEPLYSAEQRPDCLGGADSAFLPIGDDLGLALSPVLSQSKVKTTGWKKWSQAVKMCFSSTSRARAQYSALNSTEGSLNRP